MLNLERLCLAIGFNQEQTAVLMMGKPLEYSGEDGLIDCATTIKI